MSVVKVLRDARALVVKGWSEPWAVDKDGHCASLPFTTGAADVVRWSVEDACLFASKLTDDGHRAIELLAEVAGFAGLTVTFHHRIAQLHGHGAKSVVLDYFKSAILRAQKLEADR